MKCEFELAVKPYPQPLRGFFIKYDFFISHLDFYISKLLIEPLPIGFDKCTISVFDIS